MRFCYKRVSSVDQQLDRQLFGLDFDREFVEKVSGKNTDRPELQNLLAMLREGDTVDVHELSRLGRNCRDLLEIVAKVLDAGASIKFHKENLEFIAGEKQSPMQELMLGLLASISQFERSLIRERQAEGISIAKAKGVYKGRKSNLTEDDIKRLRVEFSQTSNKASLAKRWNISRSYLYKLQACEPVQLFK